MKVSEIMVHRLRAAGVAMPDNVIIERTRYKRESLSRGAWSWRVLDAKTFAIIAGSLHTMTELSRAQRWTLVDQFQEVSIFPTPAEGPLVDESSTSFGEPKRTWDHDFGDGSH